MPVENINSQLLSDLHGGDPVRDTVLIVEDSPTVSHLLKGQVSKVLPGYEIVTAEDGVNAIGKISGKLKGRVALIITDIEMPNVNGLDMARNLKRDNDDPEIVADMARVPVFVHSANEEYVRPGNQKSALWEELYEAGIVDSFEKKPLDVSDVYYAIYRAICSVQTRILRDSGKI